MDHVRDGSIVVGDRVRFTGYVSPYRVDTYEGTVVGFEGTELDDRVVVQFDDPQEVYRMGTWTGFWAYANELIKLEAGDVAG